MTDDNNTFQMADWNKLAREALDLWEGHLNALASDPTAREEMVKFIAPMSHMFNQWSDMMQGTFQAASSCASAPTAAPETAQEETAQEPEAPNAEEAKEQDAEAAWEEQIMKAAQASAQEALETYMESLHTSVGETGAVLDIAASAVGEIQEAETPVYASHAGAAFAALQDVMSDLSQDTISAEEDRVAVDDTTAIATTAAIVTDAKPDLSVSAAAPDSGRTAAASGPRDLAELASRLAQLERELDGIRAQGKAGVSSSALDDADDAEAQRMARARQG